MRIWHVSRSATPNGDGSQKSPFARIQHAADAAEPGDVVSVHAGEYREWVRPRRGGREETSRIVYEMAGDGEVVIKGSEPVGGWRREGGLWTVTLPDSFFGEFHSLRRLREGDWCHGRGRVHWLGELFVGGERMRDVDGLEWVQREARQWTRVLKDGQVVLWLNLEETPDEVELGVRPACFLPEATGLDFITVRGFRMCHAAPPWAPPTAEQMGMLGPNWSKGWVIEECHLHDVSGCAVSLGLPRGFGDNEWTRDGRKHGSQRQREVVFRALNAGWSKKSVGSHVLRNCRIHGCGQAGVVGHLGGVFCEIRRNEIYDVYRDRSFGGHEMAGIKLHGAIDTVIAHNRIHHCCRGLWLDWQAQGTRVTGNLFHDNDWEDLYSEVNHGPLLVDHNVLLSGVAFSDCSQGLAFVHNLVAGGMMQLPIPNRFTPYHVAHDTRVAGVMTIPGGDARFYHNLFLSTPEKGEEREGAREDENRTLTTMPRVRGAGTCVYDRYPGPGEEWRPLDGSVNDYASIRHPVEAGGNLYTGPARPYRLEADAAVYPEWDPQVQLNDGVLSFRLPVGIRPVSRLDAAGLGTCVEPEMRFEDREGRPCDLAQDINGVDREPTTSRGPWAQCESGEHRFRF